MALQYNHSIQHEKSDVIVQIIFSGPFGSLSPFLVI